ncbi:3-hydroxybenzoate 6-hydroxylase [Bienertia sinuspersici]
MGNNFALSKKGKEVLQVLKVNDGKILKFTAPIKVKNLLINYPNIYVALFWDATHCLLLEYKLKVGKVYYLVPYFITIIQDDYVSSTLLCYIPQPKDRGVRIKVVVTKQQLRQLLINQVRLETMFLGIDKKTRKSVGLSSIHLQKLEPIVEESE